MRTQSIIAVLCIFAAPAFADCVDYNRKAHEAAAARLAANPPTAEQLGLPSLDGLTLDPMASTDDPGCAARRADGRTRYVYTTRMTSGEVLGRLHTYVAAKTSVDGMNRVWYENPMSSRGEFLLTSGTEVEIPQSHTATNVKVVVLAPAAPASLTPGGQPYSVKDMLDGTPWVGGIKNNWVQVGSGPVAAAGVGGAGPAATETAKAECKPKTGNNSETVGKEIGGAVLGGGWGRSIGGAVGSALGGRGRKDSESAPDCP